MKKTIAKFLFVAVCIAGIIFLLLPFLETTPPATTNLKSASPQVATSNPLATIAQRLASLFGRPAREKKSKLVAARNGTDSLPPSWRNDLLATHSPVAQRWAGTHTAADVTGPNSQAVPVPPLTSNEYGEASLLTDDGEWVLIRQIAPQTAEPGMHEVNVHENPYDRYVKQERVRRFQPPSQKADIPDSKWARLWRPVQEFFGLADPQPVETSPLAFYRETGTTPKTGGAVWGNDKVSFPSASGSRRSSWPNITPAQWTRMSEAEREHERERRSAAEFVEIMSGTRAAEDAAEIAAQAAYPNPKDEDKRENYRKQLTEENKQAIKEGLLSAMRANAQGQETVDDLEHIMTGCSNAALPKLDCTKSSESGSLFSSDEVTAWQEKSRQIFLDKTHYKMPDDLPLLPVLGPTTPQTIASMAGMDENVEKTIDIYNSLYDQNNCAAQDCFWIPNSIQANEQLRDSFRLANTKLVTDPDNFYPTFREGFVQAQVQKAQQQYADNPENAPSQEQIREQAEKQFIENAANWIPVTSEQLKNIYEVHTLQAANPQNADKNIPVAVLYQMNPIYAEQMYHAVGDSPIFGYAKEPLSSVEGKVDRSAPPAQMDKEVAEQTADLTLNSIADNVHIAFEEVGKVTRRAVSEGTKAGVKQQQAKSKNRSNPAQPSGKK